MAGWYAGIAIVVGLLVVGVGGSVLVGRGGPRGERLPVTVLQKRAWIGLVAGLLTLFAGVVLFAVRGLDRYDDDPATRFAVYALLFVGAATHFFVVPRTPGGKPRRGVDERDLSIFERAPAIQGVAVLVVLAAWAIGLTESFDEVGAIPIVFPSLIFLSAFLVHLVSLSLAILLGYRRSSVGA